MTMIKNRRTTLERVEKFISPDYFTDVNLFGRLYSEREPLVDLLHYEAGQERISFDRASHLLPEYAPTEVGSEFGPTWSTHWFFVKVIIPERWLGKEVHLCWNADCEALIWSTSGMPLQGLSGKERSNFILTPDATADDLYSELYIEMACNGMFGAGSPTMISPPDCNKTFKLTVADLAVFDRQVYNLLIDLGLLLEMAKELPNNNARSSDALYTANDIVNTIQVKSSYEEAVSKARKFFGRRNGETQTRNVAVGHCHIDCAWLWPYAETIRKCARSWASTLRLMDGRPDFVFACSQAQQYAWVKDKYPQLYEKLKLYVAKGQFLPVGGTWVEMDGNIPSGESFVRQFLYGQKFFEEEFGVRCKEFWLPDTFGYSAQLPQIMRLFEIERFLTQKLSWNLVNKFPHHSFLWEGIDGSEVVAHFPPSDSYEMQIRVQEILKQEARFQDHGRVSQSMMLFGYGDGGGGPTEAMLDRQLRLRDVDGLPKVSLGRPEEVFLHLEENRSRLCRWVGELYLELHNATYTTQAETKKLNRTCEFLLRDLEIASCIFGDCSVPVEPLWKKLLLNQFHDVLPGTSIGVVHRESVLMLKDIVAEATRLLGDIVRLYFRWTPIQGLLPDEETNAEVILLNTLSWERSAVVQVPWNHNQIIQKFGNKSILHQSDESGVLLLPVAMGPVSYKLPREFPRPVRVSAEKLENGLISIKNQHLEVLVAKDGCVVSLKRTSNPERELVAVGLACNRLLLYDDIPLYWDAWDVMDYHLETERPAVTEVLQEACLVERGPLRATISCVMNVGQNSRVKQRISLDAFQPFLSVQNQVDWKENHKFLKVEFAVNVRAPQATYEIQFGHVQRPTHFNTSWDWAKYEVCGHKWVDLSEHGRGIAILNDGKYGHSVRGNRIFLSLLRSPKSPDYEADMGSHDFSYAVMPHEGSFQESGVIRKSYEFNSPIRQFHVRSKPQLVTDSQFSYFQLSNPAVVLEAVKWAEKGERSCLLRLYEAFGGSCRCVVRSSWNVHTVSLCNGYEEPLQDLKWEDGSVTLDFAPFQIQSLLLVLQ